MSVSTRTITRKELTGERFDCSREHLLEQVAERSQYYFAQIDGTFRFPDANGQGQIIEIIEMALAASLKPETDSPEVLQIKQALAESQEREKALAAKVEVLGSDLMRAELSLDNLKQALNPRVVDWVRCGIGANYNGENREKRMDDNYYPLVKAINDTPDIVVSRYGARLFESAKIPRHAKAGCIGEFSFVLESAGTCPECWETKDGEDEHEKSECELCGGNSNESGHYDIEAQIPWDVMKDIWLRMNVIYAEQLTSEAEVAECNSKPDMSD